MQSAFAIIFAIGMQFGGLQRFRSVYTTKRRFGLFKPLLQKELLFLFALRQILRLVVQIVALFVALLLRQPLCLNCLEFADGFAGKLSILF